MNLPMNPKMNDTFENTMASYLKVIKYVLFLKTNQNSFKMKNIFTLTVAIFLFSNVMGQEQGTFMPLNYATVKKKVEKSDADIQNPKKNVKAATWEKRGELFQDVFMIGLEQIQEGMSPNTVQVFYKEPKEIKDETKNGVKYETYVYDHINYLFVNGAFQSWEVTDPINPDPLDESMKSYFKALDLDEKGSLKDKIKENLVELKGQLKRQGVNDYYTDHYEAALNSFKSVLKINELDLFAGEFDTIMVQYSGIIAREIAQKTGDKDLYMQAINFYQQLADANFGGPNTYLQLKQDWMAIGDTIKAVKILEEGYEKYPDTVNLVANITDTYIQIKDIDGGLKFINQAIEKTPNQAENYYWKGRLLINIQENGDSIDDAIEVYKKAAELKPTLYYVWYDLGYIYYLQGADYYERSNTEENENIRKQLLELGEERYHLAIPALEKAVELNTGKNPEVKYETLDLLQRIYYKEQRMDDYERVKKMKADMQ